jgi:hypothetical protein
LWGTRYSGIPIRGGAFNLIVGSGGTPISGATTTDLKTAFTAVSVHLGITATKNAAGASIPAPAEILPRQQIFSTPFAFRADTAASVQPDGVLSTAIKDGEVKSPDLADGSVTTAKLGSGAVTLANIAANAINGSVIAQNSIDPDRLAQDCAYFIDEKPSGTAGGTPSASQRRTLNKSVISMGNSITRSGDLITLQPGTYMVDATVPGYNIQHNAYLIDTTTSAILLQGQQAQSQYTSTVSIKGPLIITGSAATIEIRDYGLSIGAGALLGKPSGVGAPEKYTEINITRLK